ncbi:MAG: nitroreductase family deazaflavin-dependent oxidoreductase [Anaerolineales bacterium]|nr:nitroreductase family deazaflavin-dependent oxidoreductase [Chloroflexota bacterium]MBL6981483.1 nitroreductase family deazaflavin-dependent oxidoreductase [Anaerolineales bacterium]
MGDWNKAVIEEFRANEGKVGGHFENMSLLLLHTTGAKSGKPRINPVVYLEDGNNLVIIASKGGASMHPAWYHNLVANPEVSVEVGIDKFKVQATAIEEPERSKLYSKMSVKYPFFDEYRQKTDRVIPVVTLTRN